ncbi:MAG: hypothetical protein IKK21_12385 [Clostridia bacterium]|nr:hypothetical protein [Clostridia bacterium]
MSKFVMGSAMGFMLGAGLMMAPGNSRMRRDMYRSLCKVKRMLAQM